MSRKACGKTGLRALTFYTVTTVIAAFTGIVLAVLIQPGNSSRTVSLPSSGDPEVVQTVDSFLDLFRYVLKSNCKKKKMSASLSLFFSPYFINHTVVF